MSWSVAAVGKPAAVAAAIEQQFTKSSPCSEPEETVRQSARATIAAALAGQRPDCAVRVSASGSMSTTYDAEKTAWGPPVTNQLTLEVIPLYGFVE